MKTEMTHDEIVVSNSKAAAVNGKAKGNYFSSG